MEIIDILITVISYFRQPQKRKLIKAAYNLNGKEGLEIGGPSSFFGLKSSLPVYLFARKIDGVNYSSDTTWEQNLVEGGNYNYYRNKTGTQFIAEAIDLKNIPANSYDFVLACHSLEHVANPIKALKEWRRVLKKQAPLFLVLPDKRYTFDINRPYTLFEHLIDDYKAGTDEHDTTHFDEILHNHNIQMDAGVNDVSELGEKLRKNYLIRTAHHHVFSQEVVRQILQYSGFTVQHQQEVNSLHLITLAIKT